MGQAKDFTLTTFGLVIAYFLPGILMLYGGAFWDKRIADVFKIFRGSESNLGLFLMVLSAALTVGLVLTPFRSLIYEEIIWRNRRLKKEDFRKLTDERKLDSFRTLVDEQYRYHMFWGSSSLAVIPLASAFIRSSYLESSGRGLLSVLSCLAVEAVIVWSAIEAYKRYVDRARVILG
ncbi:hypothetical protein OHB05_22395 [Streptomyces sp. NBC_00638]|uniref:hypothetical protein n=1 Tax=Streptomyces sp. NBC_00638 TaxID=2975794 RepID=UPI00224C98E0|nr:hypothetical protein [Streptomyces sp. NBC_00638]MCX5005340.1 hypothetical protein [Streptomyces sp. NBC_00638]